MRRHLVTVWCILLLGLAGAMIASSGCSDTNDDKNLLTNPHSTVGSLKSIAPPLDLGESGGMNLSLQVDQNPVDTIKPVPKDTMVFHEKRPNYTREFVGDHDGKTTCYIERGSGDVWCHIPKGSWASYYTTSNVLDCPPDSTKFHVETGDYATTYIYGWHIWEGKYYSYYYVPTPDDFDLLLCRVQDTAVINPGKYMPMGSEHIAGGANASCYDRHELGFDRNELPAPLRNK